MATNKLFVIKYLLSISFIIVILNAGCRYDKQILQPVTSCDTTISTFSGTVQPILSLHCISCHSGPNANNGIRVDNFISLKQLVNNGKLLGSITHSPGFSPMPQGANKLSECNIYKIRKWITDGAQNN